MVAHQLFIYSPAASLLLLYLPLKIHFEASLLELVITLGPPPHQLQARSHRERLSSFASFLSSSTRRNDKHLLSGGPPPHPHPASLAVPTPPAVPILYICQCYPPSNWSLYAVWHCWHARAWRRRLSWDTPLSLIAPRASQAQQGALLYLTSGPTCCQGGVEPICCCRPAGTSWTGGRRDERRTVVEQMIAQAGSRGDITETTVSAVRVANKNRFGVISLYLSVSVIKHLGFLFGLINYLIPLCQFI